MTRTLFTADSHFNHAGIIQMCERPFADVTDMNEAIIDGWNAVVQPGDVVWHLGDFAHRADAKEIKRIFGRLNGSKHLVPGNHDNADTLRLGWASIDKLAEIVVERQRLVLCHYSLRTWPGQRRGAINLYGHSHGRLPGTSLSTDVGVDCWGYVPITLDQIRQRLVTQPPSENAGDGEEPTATTGVNP